MTAPNKSTFDLSPPVRPGTNHFNGIAKTDDLAYPPDPQTQPNAFEWNTLEFLMLSVGRVMPVAVLSWATGTTLASYCTAPSGPTSITFTITHASAGDILITWPANTFPSPASHPVACLNAGPGMIWAEYQSNGVHIHTYNAAGTAADLAFTVTVY